MVRRALTDYIVKEKLPWIPSVSLRSEFNQNGIWLEVWFQEVLLIRQGLPGANQGRDGRSYQLTDKGCYFSS